MRCWVGGEGIVERQKERDRGVEGYHKLVTSVGDVRGGKES